MATIKPASGTLKKVAPKKPATKKTVATQISSGNVLHLPALLQEQFGFSGFKGPQEEIIQALLAGKDTFVIMPTAGNW